MTFLILSLVVLAAFSALFGLFQHNKDGGNDVITKGSDCASCTPLDKKCEQVCMMEAAVNDIEYFDDEELDTFGGRPSNSYTDQEAEAFREVLYTMQPGEVKDWARSLTLRGIELPDQVKDEAFMLMNEQ